MLTFQIDGGTLIIRGQDIRWLEDVGGSPEQEDGPWCKLVWAAEGALTNRHVRGTAQQNLDRIRDEEQQQMVESARRQAAAQFAGRGRPK